MERGGAWPWRGLEPDRVGDLLIDRITDLCVGDDKGSRLMLRRLIPSPAARAQVLRELSLRGPALSPLDVRLPPMWMNSFAFQKSGVNRLLSSKGFRPSPDRDYQVLFTTDPGAVRKARLHLIQLLDTHQPTSIRALSLASGWPSLFVGQFIGARNGLGLNDLYPGWLQRHPLNWMDSGNPLYRLVPLEEAQARLCHDIAEIQTLIRQLKVAIDQLSPLIDWAHAACAEPTRGTRGPSWRILREMRRREWLPPGLGFSDWRFFWAHQRKDLAALFGYRVSQPVCEPLEHVQGFLGMLSSTIGDQEPVSSRLAEAENELLKALSLTHWNEIEWAGPGQGANLMTERLFSSIQRMVRKLQQATRLPRLERHAHLQRAIEILEELPALVSSSEAGELIREAASAPRISVLAESRHNPRLEEAVDRLLTGSSEPREVRLRRIQGILLLKEELYLAGQLSPDDLFFIGDALNLPYELVVAARRFGPEDQLLNQVPQAMLELIAGLSPLVTPSPTHEMINLFRKMVMREDASRRVAALTGQPIWPKHGGSLPELKLIAQQLMSSFGVRSRYSSIVEAYALASAEKREGRGAQPTVDDYRTVDWDLLVNFLDLKR